MIEAVSESVPASRWIHANAGSGKTYALVRQILGLLVRGERADGILCLTYTNAAAEEMRHRLNDRLLSFALMPEEALQAELAVLLPREPVEADRALARQLYLRALDSEPGVGFYTLHGFCERLLARFPLESGVPPYFSLLDERQSAIILAGAYRALLAEALRDDALREAIAFMQGQASENYLRDILFRSVKHKRLWRHIFGRLEATFGAIDDFFGVKAGEDEHVLIASAFHDARLKALRELVAQLESQGKTLASLGSQISAWCDRPGIGSWGAYKQAWYTKKHEPRKLVSSALEKKAPAMADAIREAQAEVVAIQSRLYAIQAAQASRAITLLSQRLLQLYDAAKFTQQALDFDDLLLKSLALLSDDALRSWVLYKLDQRIDHVLIDEAQDTSPEQWAILEAMLTELLQPGGQGEKTLFVVGDLKQSIYSFQGAAPQLFVAQRPLFARQLEMSGTRLHIGHLAVSRRSVPLVMDMVNTVCAQPAVAAAFIEQESYHPHISHRVGQAGRVVCLPLVGKTKAEAVDVLEPPSARAERMHAADIWAEEIACMIRGWLDSGRELAARGRKVRPGDILILLQKRGTESAFAQSIIRSLEAQGIAVAGLDRLQLATHQAVRDHLALFEWLLHPYDDYHLAIALRSPLGGLSEQELYEAAQGRGDSRLWDSLCQRMPAHPAVAMFRKWRRLAQEFPVHLFLQRMHADGVLRGHFTSRFGKEVQEVLDALLSYAEEFADTPEASLRLFASQLREDTNELKREASGAGDKVRVMTVHGAKGLEAPIVILADAAQKPSKRDMLLFVGRGDETVPCLNAGPGRLAQPVRGALEARMQVLRDEYYRLLYVALTRAEDELYIGGAALSASEAPAGGFADWHQVVSEAMRQMGAQEADGVLLLETQQEAGAALKPTKEEESLEAAMALPAYFVQPVAPEPPLLRVLSPSSLAAYDERANKETGRFLADRGVVIHKVLQWVDRLKPASEDDVLSILRRESMHWPEAERRSAAGDIWRLYASPDMGWIWHSPSLSEVTIAGQLGVAGVKRMVAGQIDRLVQVGGERVILDYKTSRSVPEEDALPQAYLWQMAAYKALLERDGTGIPVRAGLLYTAAPRLFMLDKQLASLDFAGLDAA